MANRRGHVMRQVRRFDILDFFILVFILDIAVGARVWYTSVCALNGATSGPLRVQDRPDEHFDALATALHAGHGFAEQQGASGSYVLRAHPAPLYPLLLSQLLVVTTDLSSMRQDMRWIQCGLGALTAVLFYLFARRAFNSLLVGTLAGLLYALHPVAIIAVVEIDDGVLASFLLAASLFLGGRAAREGEPLVSGLFGLATSFMALSRASLLPFAFVALLWFLNHCQSREWGWFNASIASLSFAAVLSPWIVRNYREFHDVYPIVDTTWQQLWLSNRPHAEPGPVDDQFSKLTPAEQDRKRASDVVEEITSHPSETCSRRLWSGLNFLFGAEWFQSGKAWRVVESEAVWAAVPEWITDHYPTVLISALLVMLGFGALGWRWTFPWSAESQPSALALFWVPLPYLMSQAEALHGARLPIDGILLSYAAYAFCNMFLQLGPEETPAT